MCIVPDPWIKPGLDPQAGVHPLAPDWLEGQHVSGDLPGHRCVLDLMVAVLARQQEGNLVKRSVFGVCGVDASSQEELRPGRLAGGPRGPHEEGAHGPQRLQVGRDGEGLRRTRWPAIQSCHHPEESCLHKLILIVLAVYLYGK